MLNQVTDWFGIRAGASLDCMRPGQGPGAVLARPEGKRMILVTVHWRENIGAELDGLCPALLELAARDDVTIVWPLHPNPAVRELVVARLGG